MERLKWFAQAGLELDWTDVYVGLSVGYIEPQEAVLWAGEYWSRHPDEENPLIHELASARLDESGAIREIVEKLAHSENGDRDRARRKWRYLFLKRALSRQSEPEQLLVEIERVYADFDYPEEMEHLVYYMPAAEETAGLSSDQARLHLIALARELLEQEGAALGLRPTV